MRPLCASRFNLRRPSILSSVQMTAAYPRKNSTGLSPCAPLRKRDRLLIKHPHQPLHRRVQMKCHWPRIGYLTMCMRGSSGSIRCKIRRLKTVAIASNASASSAIGIAASSVSNWWTRVSLNTLVRRPYLENVRWYLTVPLAKRLLEIVKVTRDQGMDDK